MFYERSQIIGGLAEPRIAFPCHGNQISSTFGGSPWQHAFALVYCLFTIGSHGFRQPDVCVTCGDGNISGYFRADRSVTGVIEYLRS